MAADESSARGFINFSVSSRGTGFFGSRCIVLIGSIERTFGIHMTLKTPQFSFRSLFPPRPKTKRE